MERFNQEDLRQFEHYLANIGFYPEALKTDYQKGKPPLLLTTLTGKGSLETLNALLLSGPFLVMDMQTRQNVEDYTVRLKLTQRQVSEPEMGDDTPVYVAFEPEMGE